MDESEEKGEDRAVLFYPGRHFFFVSTVKRKAKKQNKTAWKRHTASPERRGKCQAKQTVGRLLRPETRRPFKSLNHG